MLIAKIVKVAKFELHCETISQITNIVNNTVTTARFKLLRVASACQGNHIEVPQSAAVAGALRLITESTGVAPFWKCLTLRTVTDGLRLAIYYRDYCCCDITSENTSPTQAGNS